MKKIFTILTAALLAATGFLFTSCEDEEVTEVLAGPTNTWCKMPVSYSVSDDESNQTANLYAYFYYTDTDVTINNKTLQAGLNLIVTAADDNTNSIINTLTTSAYIHKNFAKDTDTEVGDSDTDTEVIKVNGSRAKWAAIYWAKEDLRKSENKSANPPTAFKTGTELSAENLTNFSLKRLLANYLLSILDA